MSLLTWGCSTVGNPGAGGNFWRVWCASAAGTPFSTEPAHVVPVAGVLRNMHVRPRVPGAGADVLTLTVRVNGVASALVTTISESATTADDATHTVAVVAGDTVSLKATSAADISAVGVRVTLEYAITSVIPAAGSVAGSSTALAVGVSSIAESGPPIWTLPDSTLPSPPVLTDQQAMFGRDIRFRQDYTVTSAKDWAVLDGIDAVKQSILSEAMTSPGEFSMRPEYGMGLADAVKRPSSRSVLDALVNRVRDRLARNPRVTKILEVAIESVPFDGGVALRVTIRVEAAGRDLGPGTGLDPFLIGAGGVVG